MPHRRRKIHGLYFHSSPPRVLPMNNPMSIKVKDEKGGKEAIVIKPSNIRIWIHDKDIAKLTKVLWEGQGMRLRTETSSNPKVKKFLDSVPYVTNLIKDIHTATVDNDLDTLKAKTQPPVPRIVLSSKDANGLTALHKASGLAHTRLVEYLLSLWPGAAAEVDHAGRTPLHYAASAKNNDRCFNLLVQAGSDETLADQKHRTANFYKNKPNELDRSMLTVIPDAPRIPQAHIPLEFDWGIIGEENISASHGNIATNGGGGGGGGVDSSDNGSSTNRVSKLPRPTFYSENNISSILTKEPTIDPVKLQKSESIQDQIGNDNSLEDNIDNTSEPDLNVETPETTILQENDKEVGNKMADEEKMSDQMSTPISHSQVYEVGAQHTTDEPNNDKHQAPRDAIAVEEDDDEKYSLDGDIEGDEYDTDVEQTDAETNARNNKYLNPENDHISNNSDNNENDNETNEANNEVIENNTDNNGDSDINNNTNNNNNTNEIDAKLDDAINQVEQTDLETEQEPDENIDVPDENNDANNENDSTILNDTDDVNRNEEQEKTDHNNNDNNTDDHNNEKSHSRMEDKNDDDDNDHNRNLDDAQPDMVDDEDDQAEILIIDQDETNSEKETMHPTDEDTLLKNDDENVDDEYHDETKSHDENIHDDEPNDPNDDQIERKSSKHSTTDDDDDVVNEHDIESPSPALEIQGVVKGEPTESGQLQSQGGLLSNEDEDARLQAMIDTGDMEQLAQLVLCGDGAKLVGMTTDSPEIQAFLDNVTAYMNKIRKVHLSAREGSLRDLQSALDRRKFAIAKDRVSPNGATPLHVAAIFGHSSIVRYLAGRFPETTSAVDNNGRTALHYAATVHDNGHFYNLLVHLGANPKVEDNSGYTPEFFLNHEKAELIFSHKQLLRDYGVEEQTVDEMLSDQESRNDRNNQQVEIPLFRTEEGRYLASSLGDPLIKGLTEVANKRPDDPISFLANYLFNFANTKKTENFKDTKMFEREENNNDEKKTDLNAEKTSIDEDEENKEEVAVVVQEEEIIAKAETGLQSTKMIENHQDDYPSSSDGPEAAPTSEDRDEHGQSMLHFACARSHGRNGLIQLIEESGTSITFRDELYRTARDVSLQANQPDNAKEIDRYVLSLAARGDLEAFQHFMLEGYDHVLDVTDTDGNGIVEVAQSRRNSDLVDFLKGVHDFEELRERLHKAIRQGDLQEVQRLTKRSEGSRLVRAKNYYGRCALHIAVLKENEEIVEYIATTFKHALRIGDNLERTALHYAMGVPTVEILSRILIRNGAKRVLKDLKGRQPSYYFMNKADILRLQEEEDQ